MSIYWEDCLRLRNISFDWPNAVCHVELGHKKFTHGRCWFQRNDKRVVNESWDVSVGAIYVKPDDVYRSITLKKTQTRPELANMEDVCTTSTSHPHQSSLKTHFLQTWPCSSVLILFNSSSSFWKNSGRRSPISWSRDKANEIIFLSVSILFLWIMQVTFYTTQ